MDKTNQPLDGPPLSKADESLVKTFTVFFREAEARGDGKQASKVRKFIDGVYARNLIKHDLLRAFASHGDGFELKSRNREAWVVLLPDASEPGRYRHQSFDKSGFCGHSSHDTSEAALLDAISCGYCIPDDGALKRLSATSEFHFGNACTSLMSQMNKGLIPWREGQTRLEQMQEEFRRCQKGSASSRLQPQ